PLASIMVSTMSLTRRRISGWVGSATGWAILARPGGALRALLRMTMGEIRGWGWHGPRAKTLKPAGGQGNFLLISPPAFKNPFGSYPLQIIVRDNNIDQALKALKKKMKREGIFREMKLRGAYEKPSEKRARERA